MATGDESDLHGRVVERLQRGMEAGGRHRNLIETALAMWDDYHAERAPPARKPEVIAATFEYVTGVYEGADSVRQTEIAKRHGTSAGSISRLWPDVDETLGLGLYESMRVQRGSRVAAVREAMRETGLLDALREMFHQQMDRAEELEPIELEAVRLERLRALPRTGERWVAVRRDFPVWVQVGGEPTRPDLLLCHDETNELVVGHRLVDPAEPERAVVDLAVDAMAAPMAGSARRPARVEMEDEALVEASREALSSGGVEVAVGSSERIRELVESLAEHMQESAPPPSHFGDDEVTPELVGRFYEAAGRLVRAAPWRLAHDRQVVLVDTGAEPLRSACVSIIGSAGMDYGLVVFDDTDHIEIFEEMQEAGFERPGVPVRSLSFAADDELPDELRAEVEQHGWRQPAEGWWPMAMAVTEDGGPLPASAALYRVLIACADAVSWLAEERPDVFERWPDETVEMQVPGPGGESEVRLRAPHPDAEDLLED